MNTDQLLSTIDAEIALLRQARNLLAGQEGYRPASAPKRGGARFMSAAARARIGAATKARWAAGKMGKQSQSRAKKIAAKKVA